MSQGGFPGLAISSPTSLKVEKEKAQLRQEAPPLLVERSEGQAEEDCSDRGTVSGVEETEEWFKSIGLGDDPIFPYPPSGKY